MLQTSLSSHICHYKCNRHLCQISVFEIKISTFECSFDFPSANNGYELLLATITQILKKLVITAVKYVIFYKRVHYISAKIILVSLTSIFVGE